MPNESNLQTINNILSVNTTDCIYTKCYCEENIWKLCERVQKDKPDLIKHCFAIFVSNPRRSVPLWCQKASRGDPWQDPVIWDYHVFLVYHVGGTKNSLVYDLDTVLPFPESFESYFNSTFRNDNELQQKHRRLFRVIPANEYLTDFASNRTHMKDAKVNLLTQLYMIVNMSKLLK